jgi:hypothetical protein
MPQEATTPLPTDAETHRYVVEAQIGALRPGSVGVICTLLIPWGLAATYDTICMLASALRPFGLSISAFLAILSGSLVWIVIGAVLAWRLHRASLWAWFGAVSVSAIGAGGPALLLVQAVRGGLVFPTALGLAPSDAVVGVLSLSLLALLLRRDVRAWLANIDRLKALPAAGVDCLVASSRGAGGG